MATGLLGSWLFDRGLKVTFGKALASTIVSSRFYEEASRGGHHLMSREPYQNEPKNRVFFEDNPFEGLHMSGLWTAAGRVK